MKKKLPVIIAVICAVVCIAVIVTAVIFALRPGSYTEQNTETAEASDPTGVTVAGKDNIGFDIFE